MNWSLLRAAELVSRELPKRPPGLLGAELMGKLVDESTTAEIVLEELVTVRTMVAVLVLEIMVSKEVVDLGMVDGVAEKPVEESKIGSVLKRAVTEEMVVEEVVVETMVLKEDVELGMDNELALSTGMDNELVISPSMENVVVMSTGMDDELVPSTGRGDKLVVATGIGVKEVI